MSTTQLNVLIPKELKQEIAIAAIRSGKTLQEYVNEVLWASVNTKKSIAA